MKNVTITVEDSVLEWARIEAARRGSSVSRMVGEMLAEKMRAEDAYERAMHEWLARPPLFTSDGQSYMSREELYGQRLDRFR